MNSSSESNKSLMRQKSNSFHGSLLMTTDELPQIHRPKTHPDLLVKIRGLLQTSVSGNHKLTKLLLNVTIGWSLGPVRVLLSTENTVEDLIKAALDVYVKEKRRPLLTETDRHCYELHYSQFNFESLDLKEKLIYLGSRNFYLCSKQANPVNSRWSDRTK